MTLQLTAPSSLDHPRCRWCVPVLDLYPSGDTARSPMLLRVIGGPGSCFCFASQSSTSVLTEKPNGLQRCYRGFRGHLWKCCSSGCLWALVLWLSACLHCYQVALRFQARAFCRASSPGRGASFNNAVGAHERKRRDDEACRARGLKIDNEGKAGRLLDRYLSGLRPFQNLVNENSHLTKRPA